ncbi:MAG: hypothetical protein DHS20C07_22430 [Methyloligella sp.]|nr:MAG: hypothetical protein DHS20C07_22430 [Methyloligella sp.]
MTTLYAQPYDISASGFYFDNAEEYLKQAKVNRNDYNQPVEEYEIQFIEGESIDVALANAWGLSQCSLESFFKVTDNWSEYEKQCFIIAIGECGYDFDPQTVNPDDFDVTLYQFRNMTELAEHFVEEGLFGEIPKALEWYIDYESIAYNLSMEYAEVMIAGKNFIYICP